MKKILFVLAAITVIISCGKKPLYNDPVPEHDTFTIPSSYTNDTRVINVWKPNSYSENNPLPVLYMPDGGTKEDFPHIANTLNKLILEQRIPPMILVGIENTKRGRDLTGASQTPEDEQYCPLSDGAKNFRMFITNELFASIEEKYKVTPKRAIIGESLAGLFIIETFLQAPETFDTYIAMDPSLWWNNHYLVKNADALLDNLPKDPKTLWFAGSNTEDISVYTQMLKTTLTKKELKSLRWKYADEPKEKHNTIFRATKEKALVWAFSKT